MKLSFGQVFGEGAEGQELEVTLNGAAREVVQAGRSADVLHAARSRVRPRRLPSRSPIPPKSA